MDKQKQKSYNFYAAIARLIPAKIKRHYAELLDYSFIKVSATAYVGFILVFGLLVALVIAAYFVLLFPFNFWIVFVASFFGFELFSYVWLLLSADRKARFVERILPDALALMSSNLRAGYTVDRALLLSARPEFGPLSTELEIAGRHIATGKSVAEALQELTMHIKSAKLNKVIKLIITSLHGGGRLAELLDQLSRNLRQEELIQARARASIYMYGLFIVAVIAIAAPVLFGEASFLVEVASEKMMSIELPKEAISQAQAMHPMPTMGMQTSIQPAFVFNFAIACLITTSIFGSIILGLILHGKERYGFKYMLPLMLVALTVFYLVRAALRYFLGGLLG